MVPRAARRRRATRARRDRSRLGQTRQVQLGQQAANFLRAPLERRQQSTLETLAQSAHAWTPERDCSVAEAQPPWFAEAVAIANRGIDRRAQFISAAGEQPVGLPPPTFAAGAPACPAGRTLPASPRSRLTPRPTRCSSSSRAASPSVRALVAPEVLVANRRLHRPLSFTRLLTLSPYLHRSIPNHAMWALVKVPQRSLMRLMELAE